MYCIVRHRGSSEFILNNLLNPFYHYIPFWDFKMSVHIMSCTFSINEHTSLSVTQLVFSISPFKFNRLVRTLCFWVREVLDRDAIPVIPNDMCFQWIDYRLGEGIACSILIGCQRFQIIFRWYLADRCHDWPQCRNYDSLRLSWRVSTLYRLHCSRFC